MPNLFVYDHLRSKSGDPFHAERSLGRMVLQDIPISGFRLHDLDFGPAAVPGTEADRIYGDLIQLSRPALLELDREVMGCDMQNLNRSVFLRHALTREIKLGHPPVHFHLYLLNEGSLNLRTRPSEDNLIPSGSWLDHLRSIAKR